MLQSIDSMGPCSGEYVSIGESKRFWGRFADAAAGAIFTAGVLWLANYAQPHGGIGSLKEGWGNVDAVDTSSLVVDCSDADASCGSLLWPLPASYAAGSTALCVPTTLAFQLDAGARASSVVRDAVARYSSYIFSHGELSTSCGGSPTIEGVTISVADGTDGYPALDDDVSYSIHVAVEGGARITSQTVWGALHGLETFSQLVTFHRGDRLYVLENAPIFVEDAPRFAYRGVMVDVARHWMPISSLETVVDGMAFSKLNVLHLHLSDQESWPLESVAFPDMWESAFSDYEVYTRKELRRFVEYARVRGVAVLPEFDSPGHSKSMCRGAPEDVCMSTCSTDNWPLRPVNRTLEFLDDLYHENYGGDDPLFPFSHAHLGGDEVKYDCWDEDNVSSTFLTNHNLTSEQTYLLMLNTNARRLATTTGKRAIAWDDAYYYFRDDVDTNLVLMFWSNVADLMQEATDNGHHVIAAPSTPLYLTSSDNWGAADVYNYDPCDPSNPVDTDNTVNTTESCERVLGMEVAAWAEYMDASSLVNTLFPRASVMAERAWSSSDLLTFSNFSHANNVSTTARLGHFRCRLVQRGVSANPISVDWHEAAGGSAPGVAGSCMYQ